jgi:NADH:ubiquinone oxidoreductase subunit 2 (subunit N)
MVVMYMQEPEEDAPSIAVGPLATAVIGIAALSTVFFFLAWGPLFDLADKATMYFS